MATQPFKKLGTDYQNIAHFMIKNQPLGFLWADHSLNIQYISPELENFFPERDIQINESLTVHFPEIVGLESRIQEILIWQREPISLENINLEQADGEIKYLSLILYAGRRDEKMGLFLVVKDNTESGKIIQELNQSRNELRLLKNQLELTNKALSEINKEQGMDIVAAAQNVSKLYELSREELAERKRIEKELRTAYDQTLKGWSLALNLRDSNTDKHSQRVVEMTLKLACNIGIPEEELTHIWRGVVLHDIGKMGIPDKILLKPGPLTEEEWEIMKLHPVFAFEMLSDIPFLKPSVDIPYNHHEKWDGSGYPRGLNGKETPISARVFSIIDVFDALTSDRIYRPAWKVEDAIAYIKEEAGTRFDPEIVRKFLEMIESEPEQLIRNYK